MIEAITFDLDGVYFPSGKATFLRVLGDLGVSAAEAERVFLKSEQMEELYKKGKMTDEEFWTWAASEWKIGMKPNELIDLLVAGYTVDQRVAEIVKNVRTNGYKTLICSNNFPARINGLQKKFGFLNDFDVAVFSYEIGARKPDKKIFEELICRAGIPAESIVFADDNAVNLAGARELGITSFLYEGFDSFLSNLRALGVQGI
jgi:HAD superfamily hydrolase (TIGR01509 family)